MWQFLGKTSQLTVSNSAFAAIVINVPCKLVRITESRAVVGYPTSDFLIAKPSASDTPVRIQAGAQYQFEAGDGSFRQGQIIGYVSMVAGTTTFDQDEGQSA